MSGFIFLRGANIEYIEGSALRLRAPGVERCLVDSGYGTPLRHPCCRSPRRFQALRRNFWRLTRGAVDHLVARQVPSLCAVFQRHNLVGKTGVDQRLRPDNAASAATAVDDDQGVRRWDQVGKTIHQFRPRHTNGPWDAIAVIFLVGAAVEDYHILAAVDHAFERLGRDPRSLGFMLHHFGKGFTGHVNAIVEAIARLLPSGDAAVEPRHLGIAQGHHAGCGQIS